MNSFWLTSYIALWFLVALLSLVVVLLARQVGLIYRRLGPAPARIEDEGPPIGDLAPQTEASTVNGELITLGRAEPNRHQLIVFISATCPSCERLIPGVRAIHKREREVQILLVSLLADESMMKAFVSRHKIESIPCVLSFNIARQFNVLHPPYGVLLDDLGRVKAKGVVNNLDHLESLLRAAELVGSTVAPVLNIEQQLATAEQLS
jgi:methylamine dehydrogenase accessory protein MauD